MPSDQALAIFAECDKILRESADLLARAQRSPSPSARRETLRDTLVVTEGPMRTLSDDVLLDVIGKALGRTVCEERERYDRELEPLRARIVELERALDHDERSKIVDLPSVPLLRRPSHDA